MLQRTITHYCRRLLAVQWLRSDCRLVVGCALLLGVAEGRAEEGQHLISAEYEEVGQTCLSSAASAQLLDELRKASILPSAPLAISAFSDQVELRQAAWRQSSACVKGQVPEFLAGHDRIAWLRALAIIEAARAAGLAAFSRSPRLLTGADASYQSHDPYDLVVILQRSPGSGRGQRRVDVRWTDPQAAQTPSELAQAASSGGRPPAGAGLPALPAARSLQEDHNSAAWTLLSSRIGGWALTSLGLATVAMGIGFLGAGGYKHSRALDSYDPSFRQTMTEDAQEMFIGGGVAAGIGTGLIAVGALLVQTSKEQPRKSAEQKQEQSLDSTLTTKGNL